MNEITKFWITTILLWLVGMFIMGLVLLLI